MDNGDFLSPIVHYQLSILNHLICHLRQELNADEANLFFRIIAA